MATRFYFPVSDAAAITPAVHSNWGYTSEALVRKLNSVKGSSAITTGSQIGAWTPGQQALDRQYISDGMAAGIVFTNAVTSFTMQLMVREYAAADNVDRIVLAIRVLSNDGSTVRVVLRNSSSSAGEFINNATHRNKSFNTAGASTVSASYTTVAGDRLVIEIGYLDASGSSPEASAKWGENATDLPANETQTTDGAGWIEFSNTITFSSPTEVLPGFGALTLAGFAPSVVATNHKNVLPAVGELAATGFSPSVVINVISQPALGEISLAGFSTSVAVTNHLNVSAGVGALVATGFEPSVSVTDHKNVLPSLGELSLAGFSPIITISDHKVINTGLGEILFTGFHPTVEAPRVISVAKGELVLAGFSPVIETSSGSVSVTAGLGELVLTAYDPEVTATQTRRRLRSVGAGLLFKMRLNKQIRR
jgi:hypothetical protein